ncbi:bacteriorhodopsin [Halorientalis sp.]|jgi:sensory rhodopsin|uniref:bacteriorhodopsin n=1 Tax=Halorientalis sp. TaxID=1931229 RepID=UPI002609A65A|nr:bacteriorhodopsin [Halorientalis sp.]
MVGSAVWFGIGASIFFISIVFFVWFAARRGTLRSPFYYLPPVHAAVAGTAYLGMTAAALGLLPGIVDIELLRFADWMISTPIITYYIGLLADVDSSTRSVAVGMNVLMIALGYLFIVLSGPLQWIAFSASLLLFVGLVYLFVRTFGQASVGASRTARSLFISTRDLTVTVWSIYPLIYLLGPLGAGVLQAADLDFTVVVLDLTAKVGLMSIILLRQYELNKFVSRDVSAVSRSADD